MYVTTFYSFKGGVGRTLALLNVAYELAQSGHRVLVVDFDLEAPAIHDRRWKSPVSDVSPDAVGACSDHPGIVEYVNAYLAETRSPNVAEYITAATPEKCEGEIALMPAGRIDETYGHRLSEIDWNDLYVHYDGYVMFEDMRAQWAHLGYDYVLLDSRTGFTDVGGICTRHLPDAVVTMFRPDDQSLRGMTGVVASIRGEEKTPRRQHEIELHFVMASIPAADDEDDILEEHRQAFEVQLEIPSEQLLAIRQYQSMDLLTQPIYTRTRPRTELARSYQELTKRIRAGNVEDRDGILAYLQDARKDSSGRDDQEFLDSIRQKYNNDVAVLGELMEVNYRHSYIFDVVDLLEQMAELAPLSTKHQMRLAEMHFVTGDEDGAAEALRAFFQNPVEDSFVDDERSYGLVRQALQMLEVREEDRTPYVEGSPVIAKLPSSRRATVAKHFNLSVSEGRIAAEILESVLREGEMSAKTRRECENELALVRVMIGRYGKAREFFERAVHEDTHLPSVPIRFNRAMAIWGDVGEADHEAFRSVLEALDATEDKTWLLEGNPNALQALAVAEFFGGNLGTAETYLEKAELAIGGRRTSFSCWSYTRVQHAEFHVHCEEIRRLLRGEDVKPVFLSKQ